VLGPKYLSKSVSDTVYDVLWFFGKKGCDVVYGNLKQPFPSGLRSPSNMRCYVAVLCCDERIMHCGGLDGQHIQAGTGKPVAIERFHYVTKRLIFK